ncbi:AlpA family phage regulatory protein [Chitinibacter fontanus]|uniref:AlpA family phage regulatory protein n=1 Tax=Chitinibacter fontanus TaxID=1737446 RepID=A0A7D5V7R1_9NEIS|nr:AlpA family phage regulatory protein [Chitinibacter fontanus]
MSATPKQICILRRKQLQDRLGIARSTLYAKLNPNSASYDPSFPRPFKLGAGARLVGWLESDVEAWILHCANPSLVANQNQFVGGAV